MAKAIAGLPDLIVMDIHMPVLDGLQAAAQIRKDPKTESILVQNLPWPLFFKEGESSRQPSTFLFDNQFADLLTSW